MARDRQESDDRSRKGGRPTEHAPGRRPPGEPLNPLLGLQRSAGNKAVADLVALQRYTESAKVNHMGSGSGPNEVKLDYIRAQVTSFSGATGGGVAASNSYLGFGGGLVETVTLGEDASSGTITFHLFESTEINNMVLDDHQWGTWDGTVPLGVSGDTVTFGPPIVSSDVGGSGATLSVTASGVGSPGGGVATFTAVVAAAGSSTTGGSAGIGPISASAPVSSSTNYAGGLSRTFTVNLRTTKPKPISGPDMTFKVGNAGLEDGQEGAVAAWFQALPAATQDAIRNGRRSITISGYASRTATRKRNRDLSEQRAHVVERILRGFAGSAATVNIFYFGEDSATTPDEVEDAAWRRATVVVQPPSGTAPAAPGPAKP